MNIGGEWNFDFGSVEWLMLSFISLPDGSYGGSMNWISFKHEGRGEREEVNFGMLETSFAYGCKLIAELWKPDILFFHR